MAHQFKGFLLFLLLLNVSRNYPQSESIPFLHCRLYRMLRCHMCMCVSVCWCSVWLEVLYIYLPPRNPLLVPFILLYLSTYYVRYLVVRQVRLLLVSLNSVIFPYWSTFSLSLYEILIALSSPLLAIVFSLLSVAIQSSYVSIHLSSCRINLSQSLMQYFLSSRGNLAWTFLNPSAYFVCIIFLPYLSGYFSVPLV